jgi:oxygen-dependent protoporphyrinogen oxidase
MTGTTVERVEPRAGGQVIQARKNGQPLQLEADLVLSALEGDRVNAIFPALGPVDRAFFGGIRYNALGIVHYRMNRQVASDMRFFADGAGRTIATYQQVPGHPAKGTAAQLYVQLSPEAIRQVVQDGTQDRMNEIVASDLKRLYPTLAQDSEAHLNQWIERKLPIFYPGYTRAVADFLARPDETRKGLFFCGDYLSQPLVTGAAASGMRAAKRIIALHKQ